ncbi:MAG: virulence-associated E family protein [Paraprevotella sp.]|nr:virulence-associated E family protein [Paraprevotella sp.]
MSSRTWGASAADWQRFSRLIREDMRPIVSNPNLITYKSYKEGTPVKADAQFLKIPSRKFAGQYVGGFTGWPTYNATEEDIAQWSSDSDYGFGFVARTLKAIDIDIEDPALAEKIDDFCCAFFDADLPFRYRAGSPRRMLVYRLENPEAGRGKRTVVLRYAGVHHDAANPPKVEFLFDQSFVAACGRHKSGEQQKWEGIPDSLAGFPTLPNERVSELINAIIDEFGIDDEPPYEGGLKRRPKATIDTGIDIEDPVYKFVVNSPWFTGETNAQGALCVRCPWEETHSNYATGGKADETVFMPKGLGGVAKPGFKCMHESHGVKTLTDFLSEIGYIPPEFEVITPEKVEVLEQQEKKDVKFFGVTPSGIPATSLNLKLALEAPAFIDVEFALDEFTDRMQFRPADADAVEWKDFIEVNYQDVIYALMRKGFREPDETKVRRVLANVAHGNRRDSAKERLARLKWDGVSRIDSFATRVMKTEDSQYATALSRYLFTALAGRILHPGAKADMVPILSGAEGARKTTMIERLALEEEWFTDLALSMKYEDQVRIIRSKSLVELGEMRGYANQMDDTIKSFITRTHDEYVPKFKELAVIRPRRSIFIGTTNYTKILQGQTGDRRWLPIKVGVNGQIDTDYVERNREQLWAEAVELYKERGIIWKDASILAPPERKRFTVQSFVGARIKDWMIATEREEVSVDDLLVGCFDGRHTNSRIIEAELNKMGMVEIRPGIYSFDLY